MLKLFTSITLVFVSFLIGLSQSPLEIPDYYGEKIGYDLKVGIFHVGEVDIAFRGDSSNCGAYLIADARSTGLVSFIKDVHYIFDACVDTTTGYASQSSRYVKEGSSTRLDEIFYDRTSREDSTIVTTSDLDTLVILRDAADIIVAFFQFRKNYINSNSELDSIDTIHTFFVEKEWDLNIKYAGKEKIETKFGSVNCYKFLPETEIGEFFKTTEDMTMWVTDNRHLIPVRIEVKLRVGSFTAVINSYTKADKFIDKK